MKAQHKIITCRSLAGVLEDILGSDEGLTVMEIALHLQPARLRDALNETIAGIEEENGTILLGYGLCGRGLEGVVPTRGAWFCPGWMIAWACFWDRGIVTNGSSTNIPEVIFWKKTGWIRN